MRQAGKTQILKLGELVPHPSNYRSHGSEQVARLAESLNRYGQYRPVVVQAGTNRILAGHGVVQAAKAAGEETIAATVVECDDATALAILVEDNESTYGAEDDRTALAELLADLGEARPPSFPDDRVEDLLAEVTMPRMGDAEEDDPPELQGEAVSQTGDLWRCGDSLVYCGDSTEEVSYTTCPTAQVVVTSPPYAEQRQYELESFDWTGVVPLVIATAGKHVAENGSLLVNLGLVHKDGRVVEYWRPLFEMMEAQGRPLFGWYVWDKLNGAPGDWNGRLAPAHEWVFHFAASPRRPGKTEECKTAGEVSHKQGKHRRGLRGYDGEIAVWTADGEPTQSHKVPDSVLRCQPAKGGAGGHPAPYSVEFAGALVEAYAESGETVLDPFLGSGTTLIACEQLGRRCYGIEIEPRYVDVAIRRWQTLTGQDALLEATGRTFAQEENSRLHG